MARVDQLLGELDHLGDVLGGPREDVGRQDVDERGVGVEGRLVRVGDLRWRLVLETGGDEHPVLAAVEALVAEVAHVGDVLDLEDIDSVVEDRPADEVGEHERPQVADVRIAVDGRAAGVHPEPPAVGRLDRLDFAGERVAEAQRHPGIVAARGRSRRKSLTP